MSVGLVCLVLCDMFSHEPSVGPVAWVRRLDGLFTYDYWKASYGFLSNNA